MGDEAQQPPLHGVDLTQLKDLTPMGIAIADFLDREKRMLSDGWEGEVLQLNALITSAAERGIIESGPELAIRQLDLASSVHSFTAEHTSRQIGQGGGDTRRRTSSKESARCRHT